MSRTPIKIVQGATPESTRIVNLETGEDLTRRIPIRYEQRINAARVGDRIKFITYKGEDLHIEVPGGNLAASLVKAVVVEKVVA